MPPKNRIKLNENTISEGTTMNYPRPTNNKNNETKPLKSLPELIKENEELHKKLSEINSQYDKEYNLFTQETSKLNNNIIEKNFELNFLKLKKRKLDSKLQEMKKSVDEAYNIQKNKFLKNQKSPKSEEKLKKAIKILEKEIEIEQKNNKNENKDYERIKEILKNYEKNKEIILKEKLKAMKQIESDLEKEKNNIIKSLEDHKRCEKIKAGLIDNLHIIKDSYEFELNKKLKFETSPNVKKLIKSPKMIILQNNRGVSYGNKIRENALKNAEKINSENRLLIGRMRKHIYNICYRNKKESRSKSRNKNNNNNKKKINEEKNMRQSKTLHLLTDTEKFKLESIIPQNILNKFEDKFNIMENRRKNYLNEFRKAQKKNKNSFDKQRIKIDLNEMRKKEYKMRWVNKRSDLIKKKENIKKIKEEIKKVNKELKILDKLLTSKNKQHENYKRLIILFKKK